MRVEDIAPRGTPAGRLSGFPFGADVVATGGRKRGFTIRATAAPEPMTPEQWRAAERILVKLVARTYAADHPELLSPAVAQSEQEADSGPSPAARADAAAPAARGGGPESWSVEPDDINTDP